MQIDFRSFAHSFFLCSFFFPVYSFFEHIARQTELYTTHKHIFIGISSLISDYGFWIQMDRAFKGHFHAIFPLYATNWRQCASIHFQIYINDYKNMLSTSWKNHIRSIKAHIVHIECEAKKKHNEFEKFRERKKKKRSWKKE